VTFTLHNYWAKRDYTYQLDDFCDLGIAVCVAYWMWQYQAWSDNLRDPVAKPFVKTKD